MAEFAHHIAYEVLDGAGHTIDIRVIEAPTQEEAEARWRAVDEKGRTCRLYGTLIALPQKSRRGNRRG